MPVKNSETTTPDAPAQAAHPFDPAHYLMQIDGRDYLEVKWRLVWLRSLHPDASIETQHIELSNKHAVFKATVTLPSGASASGYGSEATDDFVDFIEKAETKAIGRALGALGFGTQFCDDHDFGGDQQRVVDSPVDFRAGQAAQRGFGSGHSGQRQEASPRQIKFLHGLANEIGLSHEELHERSANAFGCGLAELDRRQISQLIEQMQAERASATNFFR